jgi:hypothetical protein
MQIRGDKMNHWITKVKKLEQDEEEWIMVCNWCAEIYDWRVPFTNTMDENEELLRWGDCGCQDEDYCEEDPYQEELLRQEIYFGENQ